MTPRGPRTVSDHQVDQLGRDLCRVTATLATAQSVEEMLAVVLDELRSLVACEVVGVHLHRGQGCAPVFLALGVTKEFLELYEDVGRSIDPVLAAVMASGEPQLSSDLMTSEEWRQTDLYRNVLSLYGLRSTMKAPIVSAGRIIGTLNFADRDPDFFSRSDRRPLVGALGAVVGLAVTSSAQQDATRRQRDHLAAALDLSDRAIVVSDTRTGWRSANAAARQMLTQRDPVRTEELLDHVLGSSRAMIARGSKERELVALGDGIAAVAVRSYNPGKDRALAVTVLEEVGEPEVVAFDHSVLSHRERQIAAFVSRGMQNQQIADHLVISVHTVKQHLKSIHRKLGVTSRVELTRAVLMGGGLATTAAAGGSAGDR